MTDQPATADQATTEPPRRRQRITPRALLEAKSLSDPQLHPDGETVVFVATETDFDESSRISHLWLTVWTSEQTDPEADPESEPERTNGGIAPAGTATKTTDRAEAETAETDDDAEDEDPTRQLTFSRDGEAHPRWSPDGRYLAFLSARPDESETAPDDDDEEPTEQVWALPIDGGEARKLTSAKEGVIHYEWMPKTNEIVFLAPEPRPRPLESLRKEERDRRKIDPVVEHEDLLRRQLWRVDVEERKPKLLFTGDYGVSEFALSPDGERICYATNHTGLQNDYHLTDLYVRDLASGETSKLIDRAGGKYHLRWSPDGKQVAFLSWLDPQLSYSRESLFVADVPPIGTLAGAPPAEYRLLAPDYDLDLGEFVWSRHDGAIYALALAGTGTELVRVAPTGVETLPQFAGVQSDLHMEPDGLRTVCVQESADALPEIVLRDDGGAYHPLTKLNADFTTHFLLPRQEVVRWQSGDGLAIEGVLTYPLDHREGEPCPLIVQIHGGPKGRSTHTLRSYCMHPVWAAEGYAVLRPNFRGSEGYGHDFAIANRRDLGGGDYADIMAGVDWCVAQSIADPAHLGVMGGSYGGFMTNWVIGHTDRFAAAVSMFGIFHLQTDYSNSELSRWDNDYLGAYYWEDPEIYRRLSPGSYIDSIKTPTLILHGDDDDNTFISNSKELYQALRHRGVTTQFVHYPREGHGLREPNHRLDEMRRCLAWMDRYVRHGGANPGLYRIGDRIPAADGRLELCVTRAEITTFIGQPRPPTAPVAQSGVTVLLEAAFTLHHRDTREPAAPFTLNLDNVRLEPQGDGQSDVGSLVPVGVPLEVHGTKSLLEGNNLRISQHPDSDTGQLAFGCAVVFRVPLAGGEALLRVANFSPVQVHWSVEEEEEEEKKPE
jgi:dipeptidyl aminopeptidase/acylaminoacyl peptidase